MLGCLILKGLSCKASFRGFAEVRVLVMKSYDDHGNHVIMDLKVGNLIWHNLDFLDEYSE